MISGHFRFFSDFLKANWKILSTLLLALLVLEASISMQQIPLIEEDISNRASTAIDKYGFQRVTVDTNGRDVKLSGSVSDSSAEQLALHLVSGVSGVRGVESAVDYMPFRLSHLFVSRNSGGELYISGEVPSSVQASRVVEIVKSRINHQAAKESLNWDPELSQPGWEGIIEGIAQEANLLDSMDFEIGAGVVSVGGLARSETDYNTIVQRVLHFTNTAKMDFRNRIGINPLADKNRLGQPVIPTNEYRQKPTDISAEGEQTEFASAEYQVSSMDTEFAVSDSGDAQIHDGLAESEEISGNTSDNEVTAVQENQAIVESHESGQIESALLNAESETKNTVELEQCQNQINQALSNDPVAFPPNSTKFDVDSSTLAVNLANIINNCPTYSVNILGHTDSQGKEANNLKLSHQRAESIMVALVGLGVDQARLSSRGFGSSQPVASNDTESGRKQNRRIEIRLMNSLEQ